MINIVKKTLSLISAAAMTVSACAITVPAFAEDTASGSKVIFQAEAEDLEGATLWKDIYGKEIPGYSGEGFAYLTSDSIKFTVDAPEEGMYEISTRYAQILSAENESRMQTIKINDTSTVTFNLPYSDTWKDFEVGKVRLKKGENTFEITPQYGYASFDTITVSEAEFPELNVEPTLSDKKATAETQGLMRYLCDMYGNHIISGQQEIYGNGHTTDQPAGYSGDLLQGYESEFEWIKKNFGVYPAIRGFDMMNYNPLYGWDDGTTERIIEWGNERNGIPTVCWHINVPKDFANYTVGEEVGWDKCTYDPKFTDFDASKASVEGTKENEYFNLAIKDLAEQLAKVQEAGVPVIFRPLHEAEGNVNTDGSAAWFWWGSSGCESYVSLWKYLYTQLTEVYGIHNLIWEQNLYTWNDDSAKWYAGDDYVDMVGYDKYNCVYNRTDGKTNCPNEDAISDTFYKLVKYTGNKKLVAMPENDTVPSLENLSIEKAGWLYFCIWYDNGSDNFLSGSDKNNIDTLKEMYQSDYCITLDELPEGSWADYNADVNPTAPSTDDTTGSDIAFIPGDVNDDKSVNIFDSISLKRILEEPQEEVAKASASDTNGDGSVTMADLTLLNQFLLGKDVSFSVYDPGIDTADK